MFARQRTSFFTGSRYPPDFCGNTEVRQVTSWMLASTFTEPKPPRLSRLCARISTASSSGTVMKCQLPPLHSHNGPVMMIIGECSRMFAVTTEFANAPDSCDVSQRGLDSSHDKEPEPGWQAKSDISSHFFCQSYCGRRRPSALTPISSLSRFARVSDLFAAVIQWSA